MGKDRLARQGSACVDRPTAKSENPSRVYEMRMRTLVDIQE